MSRVEGLVLGLDEGEKTLTHWRNKEQRLEVRCKVLLHVVGSIEILSAPGVATVNCLPCRVQLRMS